jgi:hypothetical protein
MRNLRTLALLVMAALTVMAAIASTASATNKSATAPDLEIRDEEVAGQPHCAAVSLTGTDVNGGCLIHADSEAAGVELRKHVFGIESHITSCTNEFFGRVDEHGEGYIFEQLLAGAGCVRQPCKDAAGEGIPWKAHGYEGMPEANNGTEEGSEYLETTFCIEPVGGGTDESCEIEVPFQSYANPHRQEFGHATELAGHGISGFRCELVGHWNTERVGTHDGDPVTEVIVTHVNELD